jgi:hypothetical protein
MRKLLALLLIALTLCCAPSSTPVRQELAAEAATQGNPKTVVWVNTNSGIYWCPGSRWYGRTKRGFYTTQKKAQKQGYRPAYYNYCE